MYNAHCCNAQNHNLMKICNSTSHKAQNHNGTKIYNPTSCNQPKIGSEKRSCLSFFDILSNHDFFVKYYLGNILVAHLHIKAGFLLVYTTEIHADNNIFNLLTLKLVHSSFQMVHQIVYCIIIYS